MDSTIVTSVLLSLFIVPSLQQTPRCLLSREDYLTCKYQNNALERAGKNQYSIHHTRLRESSSGLVECNVRAAEQIITDITDLDTKEMRILYSPGFINNTLYDDQLRIEYIVGCDEEEMAFFNVTTLDLQGAEDCEDENGNFRCQDYVQILRGSFGSTDICGTLPSNDSVLELEFGDFIVVFRTSEEVRGKGFEMYALCFRPAERNMAGCFNISEFTTGVCSPPSDNVTSVTPSPSPTPSSSPTPSPTSQTKRAAVDRGQEIWSDEYSEEDVVMHYADLFPGYPEHLTMARDLANFHHQWNRMKRDDYENQVLINILFNQTVFYIDRTILVFDPDSDEDDPVFKQTDVLVLQTFDASGATEHFLGEFKGDRDPHFTGPGPLKILGRNAYFQLFVIDPRGLVPTEEEQVELVFMYSPLLDSVPPTDDPFFTDDQQRPANFSQFPNIIDRRQVNLGLLPDISMSREAVLSALRNNESCNPVLRAQSRATLAFYSRIDSSFVEGLRTFNISCSLSGVSLSCATDSTTLPGRTMCQIDNIPPIMCEPFTEEVMLPVVSNSSVTVTAVNCLGQRAQFDVVSTD